MRGCLWLEPFRANRRMLMNQTSEMLLEACSYFTNIHAHKRLLAINKLLTRSEATNILRLVFYFAVYLNIQFWRILVNHRASLCTSKKSFNSLYILRIWNSRTSESWTRSNTQNASGFRAFFTFFKCSHILVLNFFFYLNNNKLGKQTEVFAGIITYLSAYNQLT